MRDGSISPRGKGQWLLRSETYPAENGQLNFGAPAPNLGKSVNERVRRERAATFQEVPTLALAPRGAMHGAVAKIIRAPGTAHPSVIVFSIGSVTDDLVRRASYFLLRDKAEVPNATSMRTITVDPSMVLKREADGKVQWRRVTIRILGSPRASSRSEADVTGGMSAIGFSVEGVGTVSPFRNQRRGPTSP